MNEYHILDNDMILNILVNIKVLTYQLLAGIETSCKVGIKPK